MTTDSKPRQRWIPCRLPVFILAWLLLALQLWLVTRYFAHKDWLFKASFCTEDDFLFCKVPWWGPVVPAAIAVAAVLYSSIRFRTLPRLWWYVPLPLTVIISTPLVGLSAPYYYHENYIDCTPATLAATPADRINPLCLSKPSEEQKK